MTRAIYGSRFLSTAQALAGADAGRGRPALSDLRRATSTAYYAVFHQVLRHGASDFLPESSEEDIARISRWYSHTGVLKAAKWVVEASAKSELNGVKKEDRAAVLALWSANQTESFTLNHKMVMVADAFQSLQEARHRADYDGNYDPDRQTTMDHLNMAEEALTNSRLLWRGQDKKGDRLGRTDPVYRTFLRLALLASDGPKWR